MAKGPKITDGVLRHIARVYIEHLEWRAKEIQSEVNIRLHKENPNVNPNWPGLSVVQKELTEIRRKYGNVIERGQEVPWCLQTLDNYPIPPEALPSVIRAWIYRRECEGYEFTVRDAKWTARFYAFFKDKDIKRLVKQASAFAWCELICEVIGVPLRKDIEYESMLELYEDHIGKMLTLKRRDQILGEKEKHPLNTREEIAENWKEAQAQHERLNPPTE